VLGEDLQRLSVITNESLPDVTNPNANLLGRNDPQLTGLELLNQHRSARREPARLKLPRNRNHVAIPDPANLDHLHAISIHADIPVAALASRRQSEQPRPAPAAPAVRPLRKRCQASCRHPLCRLRDGLDDKRNRWNRAVLMRLSGGRRLRDFRDVAEDSRAWWQDSLIGTSRVVFPGVEIARVGGRHGRSDGRSGVLERYAWVAGILFVVALVAEIVVALGVNLTQNDSAVKIANGLHAHETALTVIACLSIVYAVMFVIYLSALHNLLRGDTDRTRALGSLVLVGGVLFVTLHGVSDIGITGLVAAKLASYGAQHDPGLSYTLYLTTFALESVGDVFGSLFALATGVLVLRSGVLPRWLGWVSMLAGSMLFLQGFGLGGVIASFGLVLDLIGFLLLLVFVLMSSVILLTRKSAAPDTAGAVT